MTNLDSILKSSDITLPTKVRLVKAMVFPVVMYGCESWTMKKAECRRIDTFELWCWRRLLRVPWTARRANQSILKEISPGCSLEGLMLKLKLQYFGHLMHLYILNCQQKMFSKIYFALKLPWDTRMSSASLSAISVSWRTFIPRSFVGIATAWLHFSGMCFPSFGVTWGSVYTHRTAFLCLWGFLRVLGEPLVSTFRVLWPKCTSCQWG